MKVRITNTQLHKLMVDHLNYLANNAYEGQFDSYIILYYSDEEEGFGDTDVIIEHDSYDGRLYIQKDYLNTFVKMFPLDSDVSVYLNSQKWDLEDIGDGEFDVTDDSDEGAKLKFRIQNSTTAPYEEFNMLYIDDDLIVRVVNLFSLSFKDATNSIINWFNEKYNTNIPENSWEWYMKDKEE